MARTAPWPTVLVRGARHLRKILAMSERWRVLEGDVRRCLVRVFPYGVLYTIEPDFILIIAVAHAKREPGYWGHRLTSN